MDDDRPGRATSVLATPRETRILEDDMDVESVDEVLVTTRAGRFDDAPLMVAASAWASIIPAA